MTCNSVKDILEVKRILNSHKASLLKLAEETVHLEDTLMPSDRTRPVQMTQLLQYSQGDVIPEEISLYVRYQKSRKSISCGMAEKIEKIINEIASEHKEISMEMIRHYLAYVARYVKIREKEEKL